MIEEYFGNGDSLSIKIDYLREDYPLGTAGSLSLIKPLPKEPIIVTNGDLISDIKYMELLNFHIRHSAIATMAVRSHEWENPFGVVKTQGVDIISIEEKPVVRSHVNAGVYALNPNALGVLDSNQYCDMPTLFERLQKKKKNIVAYPMHEPWLDVGKPDDLRLANKNNKGDKALPKTD